MDPESLRRTKEVLQELETGFLKRIPIAMNRDPENLMDEIASLSIVLDLKSKLEAV